MELAGRGRVLVRPSGTESKVRVMVEGDDEQMINKYANMLATVVSESMS
jgi:phosphoglucosamine mutase